MLKRRNRYFLILFWMLVASPVRASNITIPYTFTPNTLIQSAQVNSNFSTVAGIVNGNLDNSNFSSAANINPSKLNLTATYLDLLGATTTLGFGVGQTADQKARGGIYGDGSFQVGPGGSTASDVGLKRSAANTMQFYIPNGAGTLTWDWNSATINNGGATSLSSLSLTSALAVPNGGTGVGTFAAHNLPVGNGTSALNVVAPSSTVGQALISNGTSADPSYAYARNFGDSSNLRPAPTTGTLTGEYYTSGNWTTTGNITCNRCRLYFGGTVTIANPITVSTEIAGGIAGSGAGPVSGSPGGGPGAGIPGISIVGGTVTDASGSGGSYIGAGGGSVANSNNSGVFALLQSPTYTNNISLSGSSGGGGSARGAGKTGGPGGAGGGSFYLEAVGNVAINANITANGGAGGNASALSSTGGGGGGSGGGIDIRTQGTMTIAGGVTISANGGAGGGAVGNTDFGGSGGGGGYISIISAGALTNSGSTSVTGGGAGSGGTTNGNAGGNGSATVSGSTAVGPRMGN